MNRAKQWVLASSAALVVLLRVASADAHATRSAVCVLELSRDARMVLNAERKKNRKCVRHGTGDVTRCIDGLAARTATLEARTLADYADNCAAGPGVAAGGRAASKAAQAAANAIAHDLFGPVVSVEVDPQAARCQEEMVGRAGKLAVEQWKEFWRCTKENIARFHDDSDQAVVCLGGPSGPQPDARGNLRALKQTLQDKAQQQCSDADVPFTVFRGACAAHTSAAGFAQCVGERVECRVCLALRAVDDLSAADLDCDRFDDGVADGSCKEGCGDGVVQTDLYEQCDDGNGANGDGCSAGCIVEHCGDRRLDLEWGEQCDDGANQDGDECSSACRLEDGDECAGGCLRDDTCGNGAVWFEGGETCDDANLLDGDGCSSFCQVERCGDGVVQDGEECDPGFAHPGCAADCTIESTTAADRCGNGRRDAGEDCDEGRFNGYGMCRVDCRWCTPEEIEAPALLPTPKDQLTDLQDTGLFNDVKDPSQGLADGVRLFEPQYPLWSDGAPAHAALKTRWIVLPRCRQIDNTNQDRWEFPVGTKTWKEFRFEGRRVETRFMQKVAAGADPSSWEYATFRWVYDTHSGTVSRVERVRDDGLETGDDEVSAGQLQVLRETLTNPPFTQDVIDLAIGRGPDANKRGGVKRKDRVDEGHRIPALWECTFCHSRGGDAILGIDYLQLSTDRDPNAPNAKDLDVGPFTGLEFITLDTLERQQLLTVQESLVTAPRVAARGDGREAASERAMLGYFHGNCGHCHNPQGAAQHTGLWLRFDTAQNTPGGHDAITTSVIARGRPMQTKIYQRMLSRGVGRQMPPVGTHVQDAEALQLLAEWINSMPPRP